MASQTIYLLGNAKWAKLRSFDEKYNKSGLDLYLNKGSWETFHKSGMQNKVRQDEEGEFIKLSRAKTKVMRDEVIEMGLPKVLIKDTENDQYVEYDGLIGNGSLVSCKVTVYDSRKGKGHTLEAVAVENLIEYNPDSAGEDSMKMPF